VRYGTKDVTGSKSDLKIDPDVLVVADFMQSRLSANRLVGVARGLALIAPALWSQFLPEEVLALRLVAPPISDGDLRIQSTPTESEPSGSGAGDDSVGVVV
jgi:hypothetical protein